MAALNSIQWQTYEDLQTTPEHIGRFLTSARHGSVFQNPQWYLHTQEKTNQYMIIAALRQDEPVFASLIRKSWVPGTGFHVGTVQRGPVFDDIEQAISLWGAYETQLSRSGLCAIEIQPFWERVQAQKLRSFLQSRGYMVSPQNTSHTETLTLDLRPAEENIFSNLKSSRRNLIRKSMKIGIQVKPVQNSTEMAMFWKMYRDMCRSKGINFRPAALFQGIQRFSSAFPENCACLLGWLNGDLVGGNIILRHSNIAEYARGSGSTRIANRTPKTDLILWESIRWAKRVGATTYDLGGITPNAEKGSPEWGINLFKKGFTSHQVSLLEPMEKIFNANSYGIFNSLKRIKKSLLKHLPIRLPA
ncbi:MAG: peptidoglycan bridge formation glycyltransferase FemA/FemB family protein [Desulfobacteraceae bacterium]|nr:MAG: peptidoglycan bridge formation glycyltransferase FemA/FemB family protein [Desulfobacteraceae bacterium]